MSKIEFSWNTIHMEILNEFCSDFQGFDENEFMKQVIPTDIFDSLFIRNGIYENDLVRAAYYGESRATTVFEKMRNMIISDRKPKGGAYTYDRCPKLQEFQHKWEELLPFTKNTAGTPNEEEEHSRKRLGEIIDVLLGDIAPELSNVYDPLSLLFDHKKYATVLAILSVIATTRTWFENEDPALCAVVLPAINGDERSFDMLCRSNTRMTWEMLHNLVFQRLCNDKQYELIKIFLPALLPEEIVKRLREKEKNSKSEKKENESNKYLGYAYVGKNGAAPKFQSVRDYIIGQRSPTGEPYTWDTQPTIIYIKGKWEELIPQTQYTAEQCALADDIEVKNMHVVVEHFLDALPDESQNIKLRLRGLTKSEPYSEVLAILSVIASTLFCFAMDGEAVSVNDRTLAGMVLPPLPEVEPSATLQKARKMLDDPDISLTEFHKALKPSLDDPLEQGEAYFLLHEKSSQAGDINQANHYLRKSANTGYQPAMQKYNENEATEWIEEAKDIFEGPSGIDSASFDKRCCDRCERILQIPTHIPREYRSDASYILYRCISSGKYHPVTGETAEYYLEISHMYGHELATEEWKKGNPSSITPYVSRSSCSTNGICHRNTKNQYTIAFEKTIPDSWGDTSIELDISALGKDIFNPIHRRFLLLNENFSQNLDDLFQILQLVKENNPQPEYLNWEFFVRHDSESIHSLVDTALSRLSEHKIPVYILNDSKIAAQQLLSQHPLFYPVRELKLDKLKQTGEHRPLLHFVIIGNSPVTEWLVREAFWMMGFRDNVIRSRITVLAETGKQFEVSLKGRFPGMSKDITQIDKIELPEIKGEDVVLESVDLQNKIQEFTKETDYCYFAVATDSDENNLTLGTRVREALIRSAIESKKEGSLERMPPVAFLCRNKQLAWLSKHMVVEKEEYGNSWFNTRALIPFGELSNRYSFDSITGGTFEALAKCIHYQYNQLVPVWRLPDSQKAEEKERTIAAERDYFKRQYNQDSSFSMALGMPYRLFQFLDSFNNQLTPPGWNILQSSSFSSANHLHILANRIEIPSDKKKEEIQKIAEWEHARWIRWMLSRGWKTATPDEAVYAFHCGNPRQQMFACKMHPCICSYDELENLSARLRIDCNLNKNFYSYDYWNIEATKQLLDLEWVDKPKEANPKAKEIVR